MNKNVILAGLLLATGVSSAMASDAGLVTINGAVSDQTCKITTKDGQLATNVTLQMPTVTKADVKALDKAAAGAGATTFELLLSDCDKASAAISFSSPNYVDLSSGTLKNNNMLTNAAKGVNVALHNNTATVSQVLIGRPDDVPQETKIDTTSKMGIFKFVASYVTAGDSTVVEGGLVSTSATFDVTYQ
ncbi:fimbrial protein [Enterobacter sp. UNJFSC 003]|uniref:fimbrial protein n=1 Tax=Enterobacter sp. UNJFSC 003 TaxID=3122077 RepID=UPI002EC9EAC6|nr:fimbrial protein [Serratia liquefaciens]